MITPYFDINQDEEFVLIDVKISHVRFDAKNIEMVVQDELFIFSLVPYYLRIRLPFPCVDDERSKAVYESEHIKIKIPKLTKGQHFPDLDLTAKLLARKEESKVLIEDMDVDNNALVEEKDITVKINDEGEQFNWEISQDTIQEDLTGVKYGFNNQYNQIIAVSMTNGNDINEVSDSEQANPEQRIMERLIKENIKFDPEIYAADYIMETYPSEDDDKFFKDLIEWKNPVTKQFLSWYKQQDGNAIMPVEFTKEEQERMLSLPRKTYIVESKPQMLCLVISLLFSYHFELRETEGDHNVESAWTIGKLTPQFSMLDSMVVGDGQDILRATVITLIRRALSYPLHRNYNLIKKVWEDVYYNLRGGKRLILKSLLDLKELFRFHDVYYVYDKIWLEDLCSWLISDDISETAIRNLAHDVKKLYEGLNKTEITFEKFDKTEDDEIDEDSEVVVLNLEEIEVMAEEMYRNMGEHAEPREEAIQNDQSVKDSFPNVQTKENAAMQCDQNTHTPVRSIIEELPDTQATETQTLEDQRTENPVTENHELLF